MTDTDNQSLKEGMQVGAFQNARLLNSNKYLEFHNGLRYVQTFGLQY